MSFSFYVNEVGNPNLKGILATLPYDDITTDAKVPNKGWPENTHIHRHGVSVRPIETSVEDGTLSVRIFSGASPEDYKLGLDIVCEVAKKSRRAIESEEGVISSAEDLPEHYGNEWVEQHSRDTLEMILAIARNGEAENMQLHGVNATMTLGPRLMSELVDGDNDFAETYYSKFRRLNYIGNEDVFQASIMVLESASTDKVARLSTLPNGVPTRLTSRAKFIALNDMDADDQLIIKFADFINIHNTELTWLSEDTLLTKGEDGDAWTRLIEAARPLAVDDMFDDEEQLDEPDSTQAAVDGEQPSPLSLAPVAVFLLIAGADGDIDDKEKTAFRTDLIKSLASDDELIQNATMTCVSQFAEIVQALQQAGPERCVHALMGARIEAEKQLEEHGARAYCAMLYGMAESIAKASGGGFLGFGSKIGKEEKTVLELLHKVLLG